MSYLFEQRLEYLRDWWAQHGNSSLYENADDWINNMSNVELLEALQWGANP